MASEGEALGDASALWNLNRQLSFCLGTAAIALLLALAMQWLPAHATSVALGLAAVLTLLPMALLRRPQLLPFATGEHLMDTTAEHEIHHLHDKLQAWFRADVGADALEDLMAHFCADFSMVGIAGRRLDGSRAGTVRGWSWRAPGLQISIDAVQAVEAPHRWRCCAIAKGIRSMAASPWRESLAVLRQEQGRGVGWRCMRCRWPDR
jgi:hypothetical protein